MTVIAWDGKTLAADKRATSVGLARTVTKIQRDGDLLLAMTGDWDVAVELREWFKAGAVPRDFPEKAREDNASLIVIGRGGVAVYSTGPFSMPIEQEKVAFGSGRDFAEAAMYLGCTAIEAVSVACHFQTDCGNGVDALTLD